MSILLPLPISSMMGVPFADYLNVTVPLEFRYSLLDSLRPLLDVLGVSELEEGVFHLPNKRGVFRVNLRGKVAIFSASGGFLTVLRGTGHYDDYLAALGSFPHRVSMLHATQDYLVVNPPAVIQEVKRQAQEGLISLTRKRVDPERVKSILSLDQRGEETGTVYLGHRANADVWAKIYDKCHEQVTRGFTDPGNVVRVEIAVQSDVGATLRDASNPLAIFFHFARRSLCAVPSDVPEWVSHGEGYNAPASVFSATSVQRLTSIMENSLDVTRMVRLARADFGESGLDVLYSVLRARFRLKEAI